METKIILDEKAMERAIARIAYEIIERNKGVVDLCVIGIFTRGTELCERIADKIEQVEKVRPPIGWLDITHFRDDRAVAGDYCEKTQIPFDLHGKKVVLVDDVIYTGRSARGAIDAIINLGRPQQIQFAVLVDRGHRELPIRADFVGKNLPTSKQETVKVQLQGYDAINQVILVTDK